MFTTDFFIDSFSAALKERNPAKNQIYSLENVEKQRRLNFTFSLKAVLKASGIYVRKGSSSCLVCQDGVNNFCTFPDFLNLVQKVAIQWRTVISLPLLWVRALNFYELASLRN